MAEEEKTTEEAIATFMDSAKKATGFDIPSLLSGMMEANVEDATFRSEVIKRFDVLIANQEKLYATVMAIMGRFEADAEQE